MPISYLMNFNTGCTSKKNTQNGAKKTNKKRKTNNIYALILLNYNVDKFRFKTTKLKKRKILKIVGNKLKIRE
jgi:hypothetical protein